jgi:hypothetical protein
MLTGSHHINVRVGDEPPGTEFRPAMRLNGRVALDASTDASDLKAAVLLSELAVLIQEIS